jgi:hypothetical protein
MGKPFPEKKSGHYFVSFSYGGRRFKRSTGSSSLQVARRAQAIVDGRVTELKTGLSQVPEGICVGEYVFEGRREPKAVQTDLGLDAFIERYLRGSSPPNKAETTHRTERVHIEHLRQFAGTRGIRTLAGLDREAFEAYSRRRWRRQPWRAGTCAPLCLQSAACEAVFSSCQVPSMLGCPVLCRRFDMSRLERSWTERYDN